MATEELRDPDRARRYVQQSLWLSRTLRPSAETVGPVLRWCLELVGGGGPLPPAGLVADVGQIALGAFAHGSPVDPPGCEAPLLRQYEDIVLGKLYVDASFRRGADAVAHLPAADRRRGVAWLVERLLTRAGFSGLAVGPGCLRAMLKTPAERIVAESWQSFAADVDGAERLAADLRELIARVRRLGDVLAVEDVFEIEHGTALAGFGQRVALRQTIAAAAEFERRLPPRPPPAAHRARRGDVASRLPHEDAYPVGGFSSISMHGAVESLLHSQLAYMERDERPDLFDAKLLRGELLYYARDENEFLRRRRRFVFGLDHSLQSVRIKDAGLPWQRSVGVLALLVAAVRRLEKWLGADALTFEFWLPADATDAQQHAAASCPLAPERQLLEVLLRESIVHDRAKLRDIEPHRLMTAMQREALQGGADCLLVSASERRPGAGEDQPAQLSASGPLPRLVLPDAGREANEPRNAATAGDDPLDAWSAALLQLLSFWT